MRRTFFDQWYRLARLRVGLRPGVSVRLHQYRDGPWYMLHEPAHSGFFRLTPQSYRFVMRLSPQHTLDEAWREAIEHDPAQAPGQEEVFELLSALYRANLIYVEGGVDEGKVLERHQRKKKKPWAARLSELLFMRLPLWDPEPWLRRYLPGIRILFSWPMLLLAAAVVIWAVVEFVLAGPRVWSQGQSILQLGNLLPLYGAIFVSHFLHEMAHAAACKLYGGHVRTMGVMLLMFTPLPYVDLSSSWAFRNRWHRALVGAAGMLADLVTGAVATIVWAYSPPGLVNELAYNLMFSTAVYTILFNINPLMRFDGYYILSDVLGIPNLHEASKQQFQRWWRTRVLRQPGGEDSVVPARRQAALVGFFLASNLYRWFVMLGIVLFVADQYFGLGLLVAAALTFTSFVQPLQRVIAPLKNPLFMHQQQKKIRWTGAAILGVLLFLWLVPLPESQVLDGVVEAEADTPVYAESGGIVAKVLVAPGQPVRAGQVLVEMVNPELRLERESVQAQLRQAHAQEAKAITEEGVDLAPIQERIRTLVELDEHLQRQQLALRRLAPHDGLWVSEEVSQRRGSWVARGYELGRVVDPRKSHVFLGVIRQETALALDQIKAERSWVRIEGERDREHGVQALTLVPHSQKDLPSAALGPLAGGELAVSTQDPTGKQALEQFFLLRAVLAVDDGHAARILSGRSGWIKVRLEPRPLLPRAWAALRQFFQRRYSL